MDHGSDLLIANRDSQTGGIIFEYDLEIVRVHRHLDRPGAVRQVRRDEGPHLICDSFPPTAPVAFIADEPKAEFRHPDHPVRYRDPDRNAASAHSTRRHGSNSAARPASALETGAIGTTGQNHPSPTRQHPRAAPRRAPMMECGDGVIVALVVPVVSVVPVAFVEIRCHDDRPRDSRCVSRYDPSGV